MSAVLCDSVTDVRPRSSTGGDSPDWVGFGPFQRRPDRLDRRGGLLFPVLQAVLEVDIGQGSPATTKMGGGFRGAGKSGTPITLVLQYSIIDCLRTRKRHPRNRCSLVLNRRLQTVKTWIKSPFVTKAPSKSWDN